MKKEKEKKKTTSVASQPNPVESLMGLFQPKPPAPEDLAKIKAQKDEWEIAINKMYDTDYGKVIIRGLVQFVHFHKSIMDFKPENRELIMAQQEIIKKLIIAYMKPDRLADLLKATQEK